MDTIASKNTFKSKNLETTDSRATDLATNLIATVKKSDSNDSHIIVQKQLEDITESKPKKQSLLQNRRFLTILAIIPLALMSTPVEYGYDIHQQLGDALLRYLNINPGQIELFYTLFSFGVLFPQLFSSYFCQKLGKTFMVVLLTGIMFVCFSLTCYGVYIKSLLVMQIAWFLFGFFGDIIFIPQGTIISDLFTGKGLSLVLGITAATNCFVNNLANFVNPWIFLQTRSVFASYFAVAAWAFAIFLVNLFFYLYERSGYTKFLSEEFEDNALLNTPHNPEKNKSTAGGLLTEANKTVTQKMSHHLEGSQANNSPPQNPIANQLVVVGQRNITSSVASTVFSDSRSNSAGGGNGRSSGGKNKATTWNNKPVIKDILQPLPVICSLNFIIGINIYIAFVSFSTNCFIVRYGFELDQAKNFLSLSNLFSIPFLLFYSWIALNRGRKLVIMIMGYLSATVGFITLYIQPVNTSPAFIYLAVFLVGQFNVVIYAVSNVCLTLVCPQRSTSLALATTSFGISLFNIGISLGLKRIVAPNTVDDYQRALLIMVAMTVVGLISSSLTYFMDKARGGILFYPENTKRVRKLKRRLNKYGYLPLRGRGKKGKKELSAKRRQAGKGKGASFSVGLTKRASTNLAPSEEKYGSNLAVGEKDRTVDNRNRI